ncbi:hypothetical protein GGTG_10340 [Gaeumannomyces tritici R3-111a-1]|uniref:Uncharacterized protein n=1 Tax=Gaeumannomyces tritici (strain R3-111a-1) TaxID=644352 RepID=J3PA17_GAET3|nr:hypothetical protein GGTG_10340 [Gaeumannomyces tritici R3-111a-1]EJT73503.1 hypothetical protein GGTG_10340 [Gaeumannomyces tritici R3-111a-1]
MTDRHVTMAPRRLANLTLVTKHFGPDADFSRATTPVPNYSHPRPDSRLACVHARPERLVGRSSIGSDSSPPGMVSDEDEDYASGDDEDHQYHLSQSRLFDSFWQEGPVEPTRYPALLESPVSHHRFDKFPVAEPKLHDHDVLESPRSVRLAQDSWPLRPSTALSTTRPAPRYSLFPQAQKAPRQALPPLRVVSPSPFLPPIATTSELSLPFFSPSESPVTPEVSPSAAAPPPRGMSFSKPCPFSPLLSPTESLPAPTSLAPSPPTTRRFLPWESSSTEDDSLMTRSVPASPFWPEHSRHHSIPRLPFQTTRPASAGLPQDSLQYASFPLPPVRGRSATCLASSRAPTYLSTTNHVSAPASAAPSPLCSSFRPPLTTGMGAGSFPGEDLRSYFDLDSDDEASDNKSNKGSSSKFTLKSIVRNLQHKRSVSDVRRKAKSSEDAKEHVRRTRAATSAAESSSPLRKVSGPSPLTLADLDLPPPPADERVLKKQGSFAFLLGRLG